MTRKKVLKRNPLEANINKLKEGKYYIAEENLFNRTFPQYRAFIFKHYDEQEIVGGHPINLTKVYIAYYEIDKLYGPFSSVDELMDYAARLKNGRWIIP